ncbi:hypothetical protein ABVT39_009844 [Epinephelus coioides]
MGGTLPEKDKHRLIKSNPEIVNDVNGKQEDFSTATNVPVQKQPNNTTNPDTCLYLMRFTEAYGTTIKAGTEIHDVGCDCTFRSFNGIQTDRPASCFTVASPGGVYRLL